MVIAGTALAFAARWWKPLAGALAVIALLLLYRAQIGAAEKRGREACEAAVALRIAAEREKAQARVDEADEAGNRATSQITRTEVRYVDRIKTVVRDGPCLDAGSVREIQAADRALAEAAGNGAGAVPDS